MLFFFMFSNAMSDAKSGKNPREKIRQPKIDENIFKAIGNGDAEAFENLYLQTERAVYSYTLSILKNPDDTVDIVQDTYIKIRAAAHLYKPMGKPMAWIFTISRNLCMNHLRQREARYGADLEEYENSMIFSYVTDETDRLVLQAAFQKISDEERQIVLLHVISGMKHHEIASSLDIPLSTALSRYHRALKKLRKHLGEMEVTT